MRRPSHTLLALLVASLLALSARPALAVAPCEDATLHETLLAAGLRSGDLRVRIAWSIDGIEQRAGGRWYSIETMPIATLVDQARGSTDPVVLQMMIPRCAASYHPRDVCDPMSFALRWTAVDAQNQRAWLAVSSLLRDRGEFEAARAMFRRAAEAPAWHESLSDLARSLVAALPTDLSAAQRLDAVLDTNSKAVSAVTFQALSVINASCKDAALQKPCERIVETIARDAESLLAIRMAASMAERTALPETTTRAIRQRADAMQWAAFMLLPVKTAGDATSVGETMLSVGERKALEDVLQRAGIDEREAARRYVSSLTPAQLASRKAMSSPPYATLTADSTHSTAASP